MRKHRGTEATQVEKRAAPDSGDTPEEVPAARAEDKAPISSKVTLASMLVLTAIGVWIIWESIELKLFNALGVGPGLFPLISGVLLLVFGLIGCATEAWRLSRSHASRSGAAPSDRVPGVNETGQTGGGTAPQVADEGFEDVSWLRFWITVGFLIAFVVLLDLLGFTVATGLLVFGLLTLVARRKVLISAVIAVTAAALIAIGFGELLSVQLPSSQIPFLRWIP